MLENGTHATIAEIAIAEKINESYAGRVLRLTLLAPAIVDDILIGRHPTLTVATLMRPFSVLWTAQQRDTSLAESRVTPKSAPWPSQLAGV